MSDKFDPFAGGDKVGGNASSRLRETKSEVDETPADEADVINEVVRDEVESPLQYVQRILAEYGNKESEIPLSHEYWTLRNRV